MDSFFSYSIQKSALSGGISRCQSSTSDDLPSWTSSSVSSETTSVALSSFLPEATSTNCMYTSTLSSPSQYEYHWSSDSDNVIRRGAVSSNTNHENTTTAFISPTTYCLPAVSGEESPVNAVVSYQQTQSFATSPIDCLRLTAVSAPAAVSQHTSSHQTEATRQSVTSSRSSQEQSFSGNKIKPKPFRFRDNPEKKVFIKTEMCKNVEHCAFRPTRCIFAHDEEELKYKTILERHNNGQINKETYRTRPCFDHISTGSW